MTPQLDRQYTLSNAQKPARNCFGYTTTCLQRFMVSGNFPSSWSEATVIPIPKPGKNLTDPGNYRPIALTSCLYETFEWLVNCRLVWFLESNNILSEYQSGFWKNQITTDQLIRLESYIREAFVTRRHVMSVFFDLEKAYDTTWKYGILRDLHEAGIRGRLPDFISKFLNEINEICFSCTCWVMFIWFIRSGNGSAARCHFVCYFVHIESKQYHQMFASWRERFVVCWWFLYLFLLEKFISNQTSDALSKCRPWPKIVWCMYTGLSVNSSFWVWFLTKTWLSISTLNTWKIDVCRH